MDGSTHSQEDISCCVRLAQVIGRLPRHCFPVLHLGILEALANNNDSNRKPTQSSVASWFQSITNNGYDVWYDVKWNDMTVIIMFFPSKIDHLPFSAEGRGWRKVRSTGFPCQGLGSSRSDGNAPNSWRLRVIKLYWLVVEPPLWEYELVTWDDYSQ